MSPLRKPLILRTVPSSAFTLLEIRTYIEQNVNANSRIYGRVIRKSDKMKGVFGIGTFRSGFIYDKRAGKVKRRYTQDLAIKSWRRLAKR